MKCIPAIFAAATCLGFVSCETLNALKGPISGSGDFDPLRPPGSNIKLVSGQGPAFTAGQFIRASMDNTAFYKKKPSGSDEADKLLKRNTPMKYVSSTGSFVKVELDSGEVGFVPAIMVEDPAVAPMPMDGNAYQVYPPLPTGSGNVEPLPPLDPGGLPPADSIPAIIDPDAPAKIEPVPAVTPSHDTFPTVPADTPESKPGPVPLPPNGEEEKKGE